MFDAAAIRILVLIVVVAFMKASARVHRGSSTWRAQTCPQCPEFACVCCVCIIGGICIARRIILLLNCTYSSSRHLFTISGVAVAVDVPLSTSRAFTQHDSSYPGASETKIARTCPQPPWWGVCIGIARRGRCLYRV